MTYTVKIAEKTELRIIEGIKSRAEAIQIAKEEANWEETIVVGVYTDAGDLVGQFQGWFS